GWVDYLRPLRPGADRHYVATAAPPWLVAAPRAHRAAHQRSTPLRAVISTHRRPSPSRPHHGPGVPSVIAPPPPRHPPPSPPPPARRRAARPQSRSPTIDPAPRRHLGSPPALTLPARSRIRGVGVPIVSADLLRPTRSRPTGHERATGDEPRDNG